MKIMFEHVLPPLALRETTKIFRNLIFVWYKDKNMSKSLIIVARNQKRKLLNLIQRQIFKKEPHGNGTQYMVIIRQIRLLDTVSVLLSDNYTSNYNFPWKTSLRRKLPSDKCLLTICFRQFISLREDYQNYIKIIAAFLAYLHDLTQFVTLF